MRALLTLVNSIMPQRPHLQYGHIEDWGSTYEKKKLAGRKMQNCLPVLIICNRHLTYTNYPQNETHLFWSWICNLGRLWWGLALLCSTSHQLRQLKCRHWNHPKPPSLTWLMINYGVWPGVTVLLLVVQSMGSIYGLGCASSCYGCGFLKGSTKNDRREMTVEILA